MATTPIIDSPTISTTRFEYLVVPLGEEGWEAVGLSLKYGDLMAWPVVLLKRPLG